MYYLEKIKIIWHMPIFKTKNENFFKVWSSNMAYILGFFAADGSMTRNKRGAHFIEFEITDKKLLYQIRNILGSNHKITKRDRKRSGREKSSYRLQIGSKDVFGDLIKLGMTPKKSLSIKLPDIPDKYFSHFVRGYFDGDGCVNICTYFRKDRHRWETVIKAGFTSGSESILESVKNKLERMHITTGGSLLYHDGYQLRFAMADSLHLYKFMYIEHNDLCLFRKKVLFEKYFKL